MADPDEVTTRIVNALNDPITAQLGLYVLPANYAAPYPFEGQPRDHWDVATNGGPLIAHHLADTLRPLLAQVWAEGHQFTGYEPEPGENPYGDPPSTTNGTTT